MTFPRYLLISLLVLAGCQTTPRLPTQAVGEAPGVGSVPVTLTTQADVSAPVVIERAPLANSGAKTGGPVQTTNVDASPQASAPRILRGNNQVIAPAKAFPAIEGAPVSLAFEEAPVAEVVRTVLGDILKVSYVLHPPLAGSVTLVTRQAVAPDQAVFLLESALQANGLALMRDARGTYHVGRPEALRSIGGSVRQAVNGVPLAPGYGAIIVPLQYIGAAEMATILRPMLPADALVRVDNIRNLLVLAGTRTQAEGWLELVNTFDVDLLKGMSVGVFPLKYASVKEVEAALQLVSGGPAPAAGSAPGRSTGRVGGAAAASAPAASAGLGEGNPLFGALRVLPIERINSILVVTPRAEYLDEARRWIERLDQPSDNGNERQLFIYQVQNVNAQHLASVLNGIFGGQGATQQAPVANSGVAPGLGVSTGSSFGQPGMNNSFGSAGAFGRSGGIGTNSAFGNSGSAGSALGSGSFNAGTNSNFRGNSRQTNAAGQTGSNAQGTPGVDLGGVRVIADDLNNSVLVWSTQSEYAKIEATLKRLDLPLTQVLIEASIVEVTLNDDLQYGLEWSFKDSRDSTDYTGRGSLIAGGGSRNPLNPLNPLNALSNGFSYALTNPAGNVTALLRALSTKTSVKVIASPSLMVLDNHVASINVGTQTPIQVGQISTGTGTGFVSTSTIQYKDTGVQLMVTPSVNAGNVVTMQVDQSVTDVGAKDDVSNQRAFLQRQLSSKVAVRSGESIVMGGLIQDRSTTSKSGIPFLHTIPVIGNLFGSTGTDGARTELIVIITPRVVRSDIDIREVSDDLRGRMQGLKAIELRDQTRSQIPAPVTPDAMPLPPPVVTVPAYRQAPASTPEALPADAPALRSAPMLVVPPVRPAFRSIPTVPPAGLPTAVPAPVPVTPVLPLLPVLK